MPTPLDFLPNNPLLTALCAHYEQVLNQDFW
jgi:hypothetical protein